LQHGGHVDVFVLHALGRPVPDDGPGFPLGRITVAPSDGRERLVEDVVGIVFRHLGQDVRQRLDHRDGGRDPLRVIELIGGPRQLVHDLRAGRNASAGDRIRCEPIDVSGEQMSASLAHDVVGDEDRLCLPLARSEAIEVEGVVRPH
jgi:hypothetical protein